MSTDSLVELIVGFRTKGNTNNVRLRLSLQSGRWKRAFTPWLGLQVRCVSNTALKMSISALSLDRFHVRGRCSSPKPPSSWVGIMHGFVHTQKHPWNHSIARWAGTDFPSCIFLRYLSSWLRKPLMSAVYLHNHISSLMLLLLLLVITFLVVVFDVLLKQGLMHPRLASVGQVTKADLQLLLLLSSKYFTAELHPQP